MTQTPVEPSTSESILASTKKQLGLMDDDTSFDLDVITAINTVFADLNQLGIGPDAGFMIEDRSTAWVDYLQDDMLMNNVKSYMYLRCRLIFDPPQTSYHITAAKEQIEKMEYRINLAREQRVYPFTGDGTDGVGVVVDGDLIIGGGGA